MAKRCCTKCGAEIRQDDSFCGKCGRPVHETAVVATPEADVPVPPLPDQQQTGGTTPNNAPTGAAPRQPSLVVRLFIGCAGLFVLGFLFVGCLAALGGGGESEGSNDPPVAVKDPADEMKELTTKECISNENLIEI
jgi:hypothetical protein